MDSASPALLHAAAFGPRERKFNDQIWKRCHEGRGIGTEIRDDVVLKR